MFRPSWPFSGAQFTCKRVNTEHKHGGTMPNKGKTDGLAVALKKFKLYA
jgi:hypothetical protein